MVTRKKDKSAAQPNEQPLTIIGVGASAGGLEAISGLLSHLPALGNSAIVIIQHRGADDSSLMPSLLKKTTRMEVSEIKDGMKVKPNSVYVNPPHMEVVLDHQTFHISKYDELASPVLPIDTFFKSLAKHYQTKAICIVLSGTGSDGTYGLMAVKEAGGLTIVQDAKQAKYAGMPQSAIDTRQVDIVLRVEDIGPHIAGYIKHPFLQKQPMEGFDDWLGKICSIIWENTGHDFSGYKASTLRRRIQKRMALHLIEEPADYISYLEENTNEVELLFDDCLITVTNFFRDPQAWKSLRKNVIESMVENKTGEEAIRVWMPGCATGEEAYSAAILLSEELLAQHKNISWQIFASDVNEKSIQRSRRGVYPQNIASDMPEAKWLERYFDAADNGYKIKKNIRERVVFARQDVIQDPPFSKIDLVCCRNTLIYLKSQAQKRVLASFYYSLNPEGYLFLGTSETLGSFADAFAAVDAKNKIFQKKPAAESLEPQGRNRFSIGEKPGPGVSKTEQSAPEQDAGVHDVYKTVEKLILQHYTSPCVLVTADLEIVYLCGDTARYLRHPAGRPNLNILQMVRPEIHHMLSVALQQALREQKPIFKKNLRVNDKATFEAFDLLVRPVKIPAYKPLFLLVVFQPAPEQQPPQSEPAVAHKKTSRQNELQKELQEMRQYLNTTIQELQTRNDELQASNEELQSTNEELKSTNEELETSREELQSTNEELRSVNDERARQNEELSHVRDDLQNLLSSTNVPTVFLDTDLNIKRYTPQAAAQFNFRESDIGRPLKDITHHLGYPALLDDALSVLDRLATVEREVDSDAGQTFIVRMLPYRTTQNVIDGVVITLFDITRESARVYAESIIETIREPLIVLDEQKKVISANKSFHATFKTSPEQIKNVTFYELGNGQWNIPALKELLEQILPEHQAFEDFVVEHNFPEIGYRKMLINARQVVSEAKKVQRILLAIEDITEKQEVKSEK